ncbi:hypothetical protein TNCV_3219481 [Trichonephila clavipes]|nr:hypothetical protein TNCV_3219481 [Trichonephila clavipes]
MYGNHQRYKNVARELKSVEGLASTKKGIANGGRREGVGTKHRATEVPANRNIMHPSSVLFVVLTIKMKIKDSNGCNIVTLVHPNSMRNVSS